MASHRESFCVGAMVVFEALGLPCVAQRVGAVAGVYDREAVMRHADLIVRPCLNQFGSAK